MFKKEWKKKNQVHTSQEKHPTFLLNCHACVGLYVYSSHLEGYYQEQQWFSWALKYKLHITYCHTLGYKTMKSNFNSDFLLHMHNEDSITGFNILSLQACVILPTFLFILWLTKKATYSFPKNRNPVPIKNRNIHLTKLELILNVRKLDKT